MVYREETRDRVIDLVCAGFNLHEAADAVGVSRMTTWRWWAQGGRMELELAHGRHGGLVAPVPAAVPVTTLAPGHEGCRRALSSEDRAVIAAGRRQGLSFTAIGELIGRNKSVVWREVRRNASQDGEYRAPVAHRVAAHHRRRPKVFKLVEDADLCRRIEGWMDQGWSPRLVAQMLAADHGGGHTGRVSHETTTRPSTCRREAACVLICISSSA